MAYELLWDASYEYLEKHAAFVNSLTNLMLTRAKNLRSHLFGKELIKSPTFLADFKLAHDELQNMTKTLQLVVNDWKSLFAEVSSSWSIQTVPQSIASNAELTFDYIRPMLDYKANAKVQLIVTYIPVATEGIFYAMDESRKNDFSANLMPIQTTPKTLLDKSPPPGTVFIVLLDNLWTRAVCNVFTNGTMPLAIYLLDLGEILPYEHHVPKAVLPAVLSSVPAYAMKCSIVPKTASFPFKLYDTVSCTVVRVENDMLILEHNEEKQEYSITRDTSKETESISKEMSIQTEGEQVDDVPQNTSNAVTLTPDEQTEIPKEAMLKQQHVHSTTNTTILTNKEENKACSISKEIFTEPEGEQLDNIAQNTTNAVKMAPDEQTEIPKEAMFKQQHVHSTTTNKEEKKACSISKEIFIEPEGEQLDNIAQNTTNAVKMAPVEQTEIPKEAMLKQQHVHSTTNTTILTNKEENKACSVSKELFTEPEGEQLDNIAQSTTNAVKLTPSEQKEENSIPRESFQKAEQQADASQNFTNPMKLAPSEERQEYAITRETFTEEELEQLDNISQSTTNAMKAVLGYVPKDDERLCKHYDPKTKGCFKGSNCRLRHEPKDPNGWTLDKDTVSVSVPAQMEMPLPNTYVTLHTTCIIDVDTFYAHVIGDISDYSNYEQLMSEMNDPAVVANYKPLKLMPALGELVIAKYEDLWYRATVCDAFDRAVSVFYVDYGNTAMVGSNEVRRWEDRFKYIPFQAVCCRISNIQRIKPCHLEAIQRLHCCILDKQLRAMIIDNKHPWEVILYDKDNVDIGELLIKASLALPRKPCKFDQHSYIPG
ncbi:uncharacterized protein LOC128305200 isoform X1 [Anopheles moucheti]|uniref:uncharacterized protein LOC128305200 isoform X1 n=1 Tax=Anopheles moucheti TaxID=186751 RepID=UPI0022F13F16|nr:uncharacterized protein LOC128305200 isoform X1 [Anopheles moucheti]